MVNPLFEQFVENNLNADTKLLALHTKNTEDFNKNKAITQIALLQKAQKKIPTFFEKRCMLSQKSYEQSSSERVALYKSSLFSGRKMLDVTGGLGVDDYFFSKRFEGVISLDPDTELNETVRRNFEKLGTANMIRLDAKAEVFLENNRESYDLIYADPDRRTSTHQRKIHVNNWQPNIVQLMPKIWEQTKLFVLKMSPVFDLNELYKLFPAVSKVYVISENEEVKELLAVMEQGNSTGIISAVEIRDSNTLTFVDGEIHSHLSKEMEDPVFYEAGNALVKSKLWKDYAECLNLTILDKNAPIMVSKKLVQPFMGRAFKLLQQVPYKNKELNNYLLANKITQANIARHNFPENVAEIRKRWKLKEGGKDYLFFAKINGVGQMFHCEKLQ